MKILHIIPSLDKKSGGPSEAIWRFADWSKPYHEIEIISTIEGLSATQIKEFEEVDLCKIKLFPYSGTHSKKWSLSLFKYVFSKLNKVDFFHIHAGFSVISEIVALLCILSKQRFVYRPLGTLSPYSLQTGNKWAKFIFLKLEKLIISHASAVHVTSKQEFEDIKSLSKDSNPVIAPPAFVETNTEVKKRDRQAVFTLGFLSRIHPKKNLEFLFDVLSEIGNKKDFKLIIGGTGEQEYILGLKELSRNLGLSDKISFVGFVSNEQKTTFFNSIDWFVLPSFHENFGISSIEALDAGVPALVSTHVNSVSIFEPDSKAVLTLELNKEDWKKTLLQIIYETDEQYQNRSESAQVEVRNVYGKEFTQKQFLSLYD